MSRESVILQHVKKGSLSCIIKSQKQDFGVLVGQTEPIEDIPEPNERFKNLIRAHHENIGTKIKMFREQFFRMVHYTVGPYRMGYTLGVGTFGRVKRKVISRYIHITEKVAMHEKTGQKVAIKIINRAKMQTLEMHEKISREISIMQRLGPHPNIIRLYELLDTPTDIFMVTEYVPGGELFDYIVQKSRVIMSGV